MSEGPVPFEEVVKFHGHRCPGLALGYRAARIAMEELHASRSGDEDLLAIVENDACGVDAIQYVTGCTIGKGNLIFRDYGKQVYTFINRSTGDAVRISQRTEFAQRRRAEGSQDLREKVMAGTATPDEEAAFRRQSNQTVKEILAMPGEEIYTVEHVRVEVPERARIFRSHPCAVCGEMVSESRARVMDGKIVCIPCVGEYTRGWC
jgi:formylmethanofuran dehydrogenase subunit E